MPVAISTETSIQSAQQAIDEQAYKMQAIVAIKDIEIWFQDEARFGQQGTITRMWAPKGTRPRAIRQGQFLSAHFFAAICPATSKHAALVLPRVGSDAMQLHLDEISKNVTPGKHAVLIMDRASWHTTGQLVVPKNISFLFLPPYSPELNPIEQVWSYLRQHWLSNRAFDDFDAILDACTNAWQIFIAQSELIQSICTRSWANCLATS